MAPSRHPSKHLHVLNKSHAGLPAKLISSDVPPKNGKKGLWCQAPDTCPSPLTPFLTHTHKDARTHARTHTHTHTHTHTRIHIHAYIHARAHIHTLHACTHTHTHSTNACTRTHARTHAHTLHDTHTHTHRHTHTHTHQKKEDRIWSQLLWYRWQVTLAQLWRPGRTECEGCQKGEHSIASEHGKRKSVRNRFQFTMSCHVYGVFGNREGHIVYKDSYGGLLVVSKDKMTNCLQIVTHFVFWLTINGLLASKAHNQSIILT